MKLNLKEILLIPLPIIIPLLLIPWFSRISTIQPTLLGFEILDWMRIVFYGILPLFYFIYLGILYFKRKIKFDVITSILGAFIGMILMHLFIILYENSYIPTLTIGIATPAHPTKIILDNFLAFNYLYFLLIAFIAVVKKFFKF